MPFGELGLGIFGLVLFVIGVVALVLWFFLPFAVFGVKDKLNQLIVIGQRGNTHLRDIDARLAALESKQTSDSPTNAQNPPAKQST